MASHYLSHPDGCVIEFQPLPDDMVKITSRRSGRPALTFGGPMDAGLARAYYRGWERQGFQRTKGN